MPVNTSILTDVSKEVTTLTLEGYQNGVAAHIGNDWSGHAQIQVYSIIYQDTHTDAVTPQLMRIGTTRDNAGVAENVVLEVPIILTGSISGPVGVPPIFLRQPSDVTANAGQQVQLSVYVISATLPSFLWEKQSSSGRFVVMTSGNTDSTLIFPAIEAREAGVYRCAATNVYGTTVSGNSTISVE